MTSIWHVCLHVGQSEHFCPPSMLFHKHSPWKRSVFDGALQEDTPSICKCQWEAGPFSMQNLLGPPKCLLESAQVCTLISGVYLVLDSSGLCLTVIEMQSIHVGRAAVTDMFLDALAEDNPDSSWPRARRSLVCGVRLSSSSPLKPQSHCGQRQWVRQSGKNDTPL